MLPISVLVPTRNSMSLLPAHVEAMRPWLGLAEEVVAVDSDSTDGTLEFLRRELKHPNVRVLTHPPGLYQSWNFGIAQCRAKYIYISTVGETITREGLELLFRAAESFRADAVISPPRMVKMSGESKKKVWPVHSLIAELKLSSPVALEGAAAELFAVTNLRRGVLGSSASNLYRAEVLRRFPFRTDFGTAGDLAWGLEHAGEICFAIVPQTFSTFMFHPKSYAKSDYAVIDFNEKSLRVVRDAVSKGAWRKSGLAQNSNVERLLNGMLIAWEQYLAEKRRVADAKRSAMWWLSPAAWRAHWDRARTLRELTALRSHAMLELAAHVAHDSRPQ
jgi:glycosyltransferase involved in cell wall biosynthesis